MNAAGLEGGNQHIAAMDRDLPWLQDTAGQDVWGRWEPAYRDLVILDADNRRFAVFNLSDHNLDIPAEVEALRQLLLDAAGR